MQAFISIKGLFEASSRVLIQAFSHRKQSFRTAKSAFLYAVVFLILPILAKGQIRIEGELLNSPSNFKNISSPKASNTNLKTANRLISSRSANAVTPTVFTSTAPTSVLVNNSYRYLPTATNTDDLVGVTSTGTIPSWLTFVPSGESTRATFGGNLNNVSRGIAKDDNGNLFVCTSTSIFKITPDGNTTLFASIPGSGHYDLLIISNFLYVTAEHGPGNGIYQLDLTQTNPVAQLVTSVDGFYFLAYSNGAIYATSWISNKVYKIILNTSNPASSIVSTHINGINNSIGICFNSQGDLFVSTWTDKIIYKYAQGTTSNPTIAYQNNNASSFWKIMEDSDGFFYLADYSVFNPGPRNGVLKFTSGFSSFINLNSTGGADRELITTFILDSEKKLYYTSLGSNFVKSVNLESRLSGTPSASNAGTYPITLSATDGTTTATQSFNIVVSPLVPNAPTGVIATLNSNSVDVAFTPPANNGGSAITGYTVTSSPGGLTASGTSSPITVPGLSYNTNYTFTVTATNAQGTGAASAASNAIVIVDTDGDGVTDTQEIIDNTNQFEPCDYVPASQVRANVSAAWLASDCDGDGAPNSTDTNPLNYAVGGVAGVIPTIGTRAYTNFFAVADNDSDGIPNSMECFGSSATCTDFDGDGLANYQDTDSDGDGLLDSTERNVDTDGDGDANYLDLDTDNDGILDSIELLYDTDGDGIPNLRDLDSDGDGIPDTNEATENFRGGVDLNTDGRLDDITDTNGNGLADHLERKPLGIPDTDKDGIPDYLDLDSDGDGLVDRTEGGGDLDADKIPNFRDMDSDNDWLADGIEGINDADNDGIPNYLDADSDGDGIVDSWEGADKCVSCTTLQDADNDGWDDRKQYAKDNTAIDTDKDGTPDFLDADSDNDTIEDRVELGADMDADNIPNFRDTDSDNDKILDIIETAVDTDKDGTADFEDLDSDNDTILDAIETDVDTDKDGIRDFRDEDSDNDKILDKNEKAIDTDGDGKLNFQDIDSDGDGIPDAIETEVDTDKDGKSDYVDTESDGDGIPDAIEAGANPEKPLDTDKDGTANYLDLDSDNDGITDQIEAGKTPESPLDTDADGTPDYLDLDSDNDKIDDKTETTVDTDKDGKPNYIDTDSDNDGITDLIETTIDTDKDGIPNYLDPDSDGDGIADKFEGTKDTDNDGRPDYLDLDSDNDGYSDADERGITSLDQAPLDTDKDGLADYIDTDSDGDGILDKLEDDINLGNLPDCDKDGISNRLDKDICDLLKPRGISPNGDGKNDFLIIPGILRYEPNHLMIYNRWGTLVYETNNYQNNWAGTDNKGVELPDGTYYYLIDFFGKRPEISTYVYINRAD